jgi:hypothetical protein
MLLGVKQVKISFQSPNTEFELQNQYDRETYTSIRNFVWINKKYVKISFQSPNTEFKPQNQYDMNM